MGGMKTDKTWTQLEFELSASFRKWGFALWTLDCVLPVRSRGKRVQTLEERMVHLRFYRNRQWIEMRLSIEDRAVDNLALLVKTIEHLRLAEVRGIDRLVVKFLRQMHPDPKNPPINAPNTHNAHSTGPYHTLHLTNGAPLEVAEAAYRALAKSGHPDHGGSHLQMQALNAAIEQIRSHARAG